MEKQALIQISKTKIRFLLVETDSGVFYRIMDEYSLPIVLNEDIRSSGMMKANNIREAVKILQMYRRLCDHHKVEKITAVAESFMKLAKNQKGFFEEVYNLCGFSFSVLEKEEENTILANCIINTTDIAKGNIVYIGKRETCFLAYNRRNIGSVVVLPIGTQNLAEEFAVVGTSGDISLDYERLNKKLAEELAKVPFLSKCEGESGLVLAGDIVLDVGKIARKATRYPLDLDNNYLLTTEVAEKVENIVKELCLDRNKRVKGIQEKNLEVLLIGTLLTKAIVVASGLEQVSINATNLRTALLYHYLLPNFCEKSLTDVMILSLENTVKFNGSQAMNLPHVHTLVGLLFKQLKVMHKLPRAYLKPLKIATTLFFCGTKVSFEHQTKVAFDVVINSKPCGVSQKDLLLGAFACVAQDPDSLSLQEWIKYKDMVNEEDFDAVKKIGIIVALARALDASHISAIPDISCDILGDSIIMKILSDKNFDLEVAEANKLNFAFKHVFRKYLQII